MENKHKLGDVLVCALSEFGECKETFVYSPSRPQRICCTPQHNSKLRWLRRKAKINKALEIAEREVRDNGV